LRRPASAGPEWWRPLLAVGVLGGYTTFSTFALETVELALRGSYGTAGLYAAGTLGLGLFATGPASSWVARSSRAFSPTGATRHP